MTTHCILNAISVNLRSLGEKYMLLGGDAGARDACRRRRQTVGRKRGLCASSTQHCRKSNKQEGSQSTTAQNFKKRRQNKSDAGNLHQSINRSTNRRAEPTSPFLTFESIMAPKIMLASG